LLCFFFFWVYWTSNRISQIIWRWWSAIGKKKMDSLLRRRDGDHILCGHVRVRSSASRRRNNGKCLSTQLRKLCFLCLWCFELKRKKLPCADTRTRTNEFVNKSPHLILIASATLTLIELWPLVVSSTCRRVSEDQFEAN